MQLVDEFLEAGAAEGPFQKEEEIVWRTKVVMGQISCDSKTGHDVIFTYFLIVWRCQPTCIGRG